MVSSKYRRNEDETKTLAAKATPRRRAVKDKVLDEREERKYRRGQVRAVAQRRGALDDGDQDHGGRTERLRTLAASAGHHSVLKEVRGSKPKWRTRHDSNV